MTRSNFDTALPDGRQVVEVLSFIKNVGNALPEEERPFFEELATEKKLIYDWNEDNFWVVKGDDETIEENKFHMDGHTLRLFALLGEEESTETFDLQDKKDETMKLLLKNGVNIDIRNADSTFKSQRDIEAYLAQMKV